jgi:hypothetical protein
MKPLPMNLSSMKKVDGDKNHSKFQHKDGHVIIVAHAALPALQRKQLEKLPIHADEGWVGESPDQDPGTSDTSTDNSNSKAQSFSDSLKAATSPIAIQGQAKGGEIKPAHEKGVKGGGGNPKLQQSTVRNAVPENQSKAIQHFDKGGKAKVEDDADLDQALPQMDESTAEDVADQPQTSQPIDQSNPQTNTIADMNNPNNKVNPVNVGGLADVVQPGMDFNTAAAKANQTSAALNLGIADQAQQNYKVLQNHTNAVMQDYANNHIDPNRFITKVGPTRAAIGIILGGYGQGLMGTGSNGAVDFLKTRIQNDIDAQHNEQDKSKTLLGAYQHLFGAGQMANAASATGVRDAYKQIIKQVALQQGTPRALAGAQDITNGLDTSSKQEQSQAAQAHALKQSTQQYFNPQAQQAPQQAQPQSWVDKIRPYLPTGGPSAESGTQVGQTPPKAENQDIDREVPESEPAPHFRVNDAAIQRAQTAQQAQGEEGDLAGLPPSSSIAQLQKEGAMAKSANAKLDIAHENFKDLWANRGDSNAALKYMSDLGVNVGGAHLTLPDLSSLTPRARSYFRAASAIERELGGLVGPGGLTQDQADSIRKTFMRDGDKPDDYRKSLKSLDQFILSLPQMQTPAGDTNPGFVTRPKLK